MKVRLTQIDGALPNLAIMKLASWHLERGDEVKVTRQIEGDLFDQGYDRVYGSVLFDFSRDRLDRFRKAWPGAIVGGTGAGEHQLSFSVEALLGQRYDYVAYDGYPDFDHSATVNGSLPDSTPFVKRAFAGETIEGNCAATLGGQE